jgi:hypothetical protein
MVIHGAPNDSARITSNTVAMIQDDRVSTDGTPMRSCIIRPWLLRRREGGVLVTGIPPAFDALKIAATVGSGRSRAAVASAAQEGIIIGVRPWVVLLFERRIYCVLGCAGRPRRWGQPCAKRRPSLEETRNKGRKRNQPCCGQLPN